MPESVSKCLHDLLRPKLRIFLANTLLICMIQSLRHLLAQPIMNILQKLPDMVFDRLRVQIFHLKISRKYHASDLFQNINNNVFTNAVSCINAAGLRMRLIAFQNLIYECVHFLLSCSFHLLFPL